MAAPTTRRRRAARDEVPGIAVERRYWQDGATVAGIDEVGRGAWAGPLTLAAVVLPPDRRMYKLRGSKLLSPAERERLAGRLEAFALGIGLGHATNDEIDRYGLSRAMGIAAHRAVAELPVRPDVALLDGHWDFLDDPTVVTETMVRGDARCASIAAASITAKVARDRLLIEAAPRHPLYAFADNKGYPSPVHVAALEEHGPCPLHRRSWAPIAALDHPRLFESTPYRAG
jgi:ribonuclease HII